VNEIAVDASITLSWCFPDEQTPRSLVVLDRLKAPLMQLGNTLHAWREEIATMWRFTRNKGITEGFHTKMEVLQRQAYGFTNFQNYRLRVKVIVLEIGQGPKMPVL
jgi:hypothetical protein